MFSQKALERIELIKKKIAFIEAIVEDVINQRLPLIKVTD